MLAIGTSLLMVGTVELGVLALVKKMLDAQGRVADYERNLERIVERTVERIMTSGRRGRAAGPNVAEVAAALRDLANRLDPGDSDTAIEEPVAG